VAVRRHDREFWKRLIVEAEGSSVERVARRHHVRPRTLQWWKWQLGKTSRQTKGKRKKANRPRLLPVVFSASVPAGAENQPLTIDLVGGPTVRVPVGSDVQYVAALIAAVRAAC
jgi:transposase-like protein